MFNLFNKTPDAGAPDVNFPQGKYLDKDAGIPGSPVQSDMRNDIYIFFSRLFFEVGFVFNDVADTILASQAFDAFKNFLQPVFQAKLDTETITPANRHINAEIDTGSGDAAVILDVGTFEGQTVNVTVNDFGIGSVDWGGGYLIYISLNSALTASLKAKFEWINGAWVVTGGVTADYVSGGIINTRKSVDRSFSVDFLDGNSGLTNTINIGETPLIVESLTSQLKYDVSANAQMNSDISGAIISVIKSSGVFAWFSLKGDYA